MARKDLRAAYVPNWLSPVGALAGALAALRSGIPGPPYLTGVSGHAFQLVLGAGPDGLPRAGPPTGAAYRRSVGHYAELGLRTQLLEIDRRDAAGREAALKAIRRSVDRGRPAIAFGLQVPEFGLITGYDDERSQLLVSTLTTEQHGPALPLGLWPPPGSEEPAPALLLERERRFERREAERAALRFALAEARAPAGEGELAAGLAAYERWYETLVSAATRIDGHGNAYLIQVTLAARREAAQFIDAVAQSGGAASESLSAAAASYREEALALSRLSSLFPYPHGGDIGNLRAREQGARYLEVALGHDQRALAAVEAALSRMPGR